MARRLLEPSTGRASRSPSLTARAFQQETRMTHANANTPTSSERHTQEALIDEMVEETFPASDATQLPGRADGAPTADPGRPPERKAEAPHTIGNQGTVPATRVVEETVPLAAQGVVTLRLDAGQQRLHVFLGADGLSLDAPAVDRLIAVLSEKRARMGE
jgi:hypothetical protein